MLDHAEREGYALGYFESWDLPSLQGVLDAAEETRSPVIIGLNGEFLSNPDRANPERLALHLGMLTAAAESSEVPCTLIFNECGRDVWLSEALKARFDIVGVASNGDQDAYRVLVGSVVKRAHRWGIFIEAELGELPCGATGQDPSGGTVTDPDEVEAFVSETGIDLLGVSVGNVHIRVHGEQGLDLTRLTAIRDRAAVPLVLHGGTGISAEALREAVKAGVRKVNYGTCLKQAWLTAARQKLAANCTNPHTVLGMGGEGDLFDAARLAVRDEVLKRIPVLGCAGKAPP